MFTLPDKMPLDSAKFEFTRMKLNSGNNLLEGSIMVSKPLSDLDVMGYFLGNINLDSLNSLIPLPDGDLRGNVNGNITFSGNFNDLSTERITAFKTTGNLHIKNFFIRNELFPQSLSFSEARADFTPNGINIHELKMIAGNSDINLSGKIKNY